MGKQKQKIYNPDPKNRIKSNNWQFWAIIALTVIYAVVFAYIPMAGILIAFEDYSPRGGIFGGCPSLINSEGQPLWFFNIFHLYLSRQPGNQLLTDRHNSIFIDQRGEYRPFPLQLCEISIVFDDEIPGIIRPVVAFREPLRALQLLRRGIQRQIQEIFKLLIVHNLPPDAAFIPIYA